MGRKGKLAIFESSNISETGKVTPTKIGVHVCYINTYLHDFLSLRLHNKLQKSIKINCKYVAGIVAT